MIGFVGAPEAYSDDPEFLDTCEGAKEASIEWGGPYTVYAKEYYMRGEDGPYEDTTWCYALPGFAGSPQIISFYHGNQLTPDEARKLYSENEKAKNGLP
jgi:hypothetical protein